MNYSPGKNLTSDGFKNKRFHIPLDILQVLKPTYLGHSFHHSLQDYDPRPIKKFVAREADKTVAKIYLMSSLIPLRQKNTRNYRLQEVACSNFISFNNSWRNNATGWFSQTGWFDFDGEEFQRQRSNTLHQF